MFLYKRCLRTTLIRNIEIEFISSNEVKTLEVCSNYSELDLEPDSELDLYFNLNPYSDPHSPDSDPKE